MAAPPRSGECSGDPGEQCEEAFLSIVRNPAGQEIVWVISAYSHLSTPAYVERLLAPAFDRYGNRYVVDWRNGYKMRDGTVQFRLWNGYWYPNGSEDNGQITISTSVFPRQIINPSDPVPPVPDKDARAWGVTVIVSDSRIRERTQKEYEDRDHSLPPPVQVLNALTRRFTWLLTDRPKTLHPTDRKPARNCLANRKIHFGVAVETLAFFRIHHAAKFRGRTGP